MKLTSSVRSLYFINIPIIIILFFTGCEDVDFVGEKMHTAYPSPVKPQAEFGSAVCISNEYSITGALAENTYAGAAYFFECNNDQWEQQQRLTGTDDNPDHNFYGTSVAMDDERVIIGSWWDDNFGEDDGAAYVYRRSGNNLIEEAILLPDNRDSNFGFSVAISGDYAVIGATDYKISDNIVGGVYIFHYDNNSWNKQEILTPSYIVSGAGFGCSVSISGNYLIVGAENYEEHGKVFFFERYDEEWMPENSYDGENNSHFGRSVSIDGIFAIVGAPYTKNEDRKIAGAAYIYKRTNTQYGPQWVQDSVFTATDGKDYDHFGCSVIMNAKSGSGGFAIAGAEGEDNEQGINAGAAYILWTVNGNWMHYRKLIPEANSDQNLFGSAVSLTDHYAIVGAPGFNNKSGMVYFYK